MDTELSSAGLESQVFTLELDAETAELVRAQARQEYRSPEGQLRWLVRAGLDAAERQEPRWVPPPERSPVERLAAMRPVFAALHELHLRSGAPSGRNLARLTRHQVGHSTVSGVLAGTKVPDWRVLSVMVRALGGDEEEFRALWVQCMSGEAVTS